MRCGTEDVRGATPDKGPEEVVGSAQRDAARVDLDVGPLLEPERARAFVGAEAEERVGRQHVSAAGLAAGDPVQLAQLLERVDADVRVGADAESDPAM